MKKVPLVALAVLVFHSQAGVGQQELVVAITYGPPPIQSDFEREDVQSAISAQISEYLGNASNFDWKSDLSARGVDLAKVLLHTGHGSSRFLYLGDDRFSLDQVKLGDASETEGLRYAFLAVCGALSHGPARKIGSDCGFSAPAEFCEAPPSSSGRCKPALGDNGCDFEASNVFRSWLPRIKVDSFLVCGGSTKILIGADNGKTFLADLSNDTMALSFVTAFSDPPHRHAACLARGAEDPAQTSLFHSTPQNVGGGGSYFHLLYLAPSGEDRILSTSTGEVWLGEQWPVTIPLETAVPMRELAEGVSLRYEGPPGVFAAEFDSETWADASLKEVQAAVEAMELAVTSEDLQTTRKETWAGEFKFQVQSTSIHSLGASIKVTDLASKVHFARYGLEHSGRVAPSIGPGGRRVTMKHRPGLPVSWTVWSSRSAPEASWTAEDAELVRPADHVHDALSRALARAREQGFETATARAFEVGYWERGLAWDQEPGAEQNRLELTLQATFEDIVTGIEVEVAVPLVRALDD